MRRNSDDQQINMFDIFAPAAEIEQEPIVVEPPVLKKPPDISENHILCRENVFYCDKVKSSLNREKYKFDNECEITGKKWESNVWQRGSTEKSPNPCKACEHAKCEWCVFNSKDKPDGCCGACGHRETCPESRWQEKKGASFESTD